MSSLEEQGLSGGEMESRDAQVARHEAQKDKNWTFLNLFPQQGSCVFYFNLFDNTKPKQPQ